MLNHSSTFTLTHFLAAGDASFRKIDIPLSCIHEGSGAFPLSLTWANLLWLNLSNITTDSACLSKLVSLLKNLNGHAILAVKLGVLLHSHHTDGGLLLGNWAELHDALSDVGHFPRLTLVKIVLTFDVKADGILEKLTAQLPKLYDRGVLRVEEDPNNDVNMLNRYMLDNPVTLDDLTIFSSLISEVDQGSDVDE
ncbi:uncharacterized protein FIBRA_07864 [Fibroporia radiculosa]|uniref:Uncharacterized protein n=1 Tax=Fibroporia radiculosa TaxID=599839 RepID=J4GVR6_9APHY|nr:uncharacterized protein FIBRA_07864 [Fibroporia radiculosa]CCM05635.1 predicted protein [Fibroporia radiculosa]